jgi:tetratricopeptide (TPR) repeat protein
MRLESGEMKRILSAIFFIVLFVSLPLFVRAGGDTERKARECVDLMAYREAIHHFKEILSKNPGKKETRVDLAYSLLRLGEQDEAISVLKREIALYPDNIDAYSLLGYILYSYNKNEEALRICQEFDSLYTKVISREISQKWPAPGSLSYEEDFWSRRGSQESWNPLDILIARVFTIEKFYAPDKEEEEKNFNKILKKLRKRHPNLGLPHFIKGFLEKDSNDLVESENCFKLALLNGYDRAECHSQLVDLKFRIKDWKAGVQLAKKTIEILGPVSKIFFLMSFAYNQLSDSEAAKLYLNEAIKREPYFVEARRNLAIMFLCDSLFEKSTTLFKQIVRLAPLDLEARLLGNRSLSRNPGLRRDGRPVLSKDCVDSIDLKYTYVFHSNLREVSIIVNQNALTMLRSGHVDQAVATLHVFLELCHVNPVHHYNLGLLCLNQENLKEALKFAWRAKELDPEYPKPIALAADVLYRIGDYERALQVYNELVLISPDDAHGYYNIGLIHWAMGEYKEAEKSWHTAIQKDRMAKKAELDKVPESEELVHSLTVKVFPVSFGAHKSLGSLYDQLGMKERALSEFESALEFVPSDSKCYYYLGKIYYEMGDTERAIANLEKCVYLGTKWEKKASDILEKIRKDQKSSSLH